MPENDVKRWRMRKPCSDCPFNREGKGAQLRRSLRQPRWRRILQSLREGNYFPCHQSTVCDSEGEPIAGSGLVCAGSLAWQDRNGYSSAYVRLSRHLYGSGE